MGVECRQVPRYPEGLQYVHGSAPSTERLFYQRTEVTDHEDGWAELHEATPPGWYVGLPAYFDKGAEWSMYAFDPSERPVAGHRSREWTAVHPTEVGVVREMARCLRIFGAGGWPR